jgi:acetolactate synthase-1/2/3 large subunit
MKLRVADYIANTLVEHGIRDVFMVTGGGAMHLNDAFGNHPDLRYWPCHHEQACAMAAEAYFRVTRRVAAVNVTTGPGGTNAISGVYGAFVDSQAMIVISGQVKWETCVRSTGMPLRQLGDQEVDILRLVESVTKYAVMLTDPYSVNYHLERALHLAMQGRPGPVWLDIPMNVQGAVIEKEHLTRFDPAEDASRVPPSHLAQKGAGRVLDALLKAQRPVILGGSGIWTAGVENQFQKLAQQLELPFVTAFNAHDLLPSVHPRLVGRQGTIGDRAGNFAVQNSDFLLILGSRMNIRQIGYNWTTFAPVARIAMVDIDEAELQKPTLRLDLPIHGDLRVFFDALLAGIEGKVFPSSHRGYLAWCRERTAAYPVVLPSYPEKNTPVNPYVFIQRLFDRLDEGDIVVCGNGTACIAAFQAGKTKAGQRLFSNSGSASMGFDLPGAIGAAVGTGARRVVCLAGDGSIMMNIQELQTISHHRLPVKIFMLDNGGYHSIRQTQRNYFPGREVGVGPRSGVGFPDFRLLAQAHGLIYARITQHTEMEAIIDDQLGTDGASFCQVDIDPEQPFAPRLASRMLEDGRMVSASLDDMAPFLDPEALKANRIYMDANSSE